MENYNKILELLEKKTLTPEEKQMLETLQKDQEAAGFIAGYRKVAKALRSTHVSIDQMADYVMYKNGMEPEDNLLSYKLPAIDAHLKSCGKCSAQLKKIQDEFSETGDFIAKNLYAEEKSTGSKITNVLAYRNRNFRSVYAFASVLALGFIYVILLTLSSVTTPDNLKLAAINEEQEVYLTRGRSSEEFLKSYEALENKNYSAAIEYLHEDISSNPGDESIFYSWYVMGLTRLEMSRSSFLGLFPSYDKEIVREALQDLHRSVELNGTGKFENIKLDAFFYMAKANLILEDEETAKQYLKLVVNQKGSRMNEASSILNELE
jgi:hypothetical protein